MNNFYKNIIFLSLLFCSSAAFGSGTNFNDTTNKAAPLNSPSFTGNVGIGSLTPGQALDVQGTVRALYFIGNGSQLTNLSASGWTSVGNNIYNTNIGNVGINTTNGFNVGIGTSSPQGKLVVMNGNVGIGTLAPSSPLTVEGALSSRVTNSTVSFTAYSPAVNNPRASYLIGNSASDINDGMYVSPLFSSNALQIPSYISATTDQTVTDANEEEIYMSVGYTTGGIQVGAIGTSQEDNSAGTNGFPLVFTTQNAGLPGMYMDNAAFQNVGIGTITPKGGLVIMNGNVGIGTWIVDSGMLIVKGGNVGIGSIRPGTALDVTGTVRTTGFALTNNGAGAGNVMVSNGIGIGTWMTPSSVGGGTNYWLLNGGAGNFGINTTQSVGIGTSFVGGKNEAMLAVMNGNVGIGTWLPGTVTATPVALDIETAGSGIYVNISDPGSNQVAISAYDQEYGAAVEAQSVGGNSILAFNYNAPYPTIIAENEAGGIAAQFIGYVGIGTSTPQTALAVVGNMGIGTWVVDGGGLIVASGQGNVGIGTIRPGQALDVKGTVRATGFTMSGQTPVSGYVLTASDSAGDTTWASEGTIGGWSVSGNNVYETKGGNVGIGTSRPVAQLAVAGSGVGIGTNMNDAYLTTTPPSGGMIIEGNVGIGTPAPMDALQIGNQWIFENGGYKVIGYNTWYNPSNGQDTYFLNGPASRIAQTSNGEVIMQVAGTGTAGGFQTWADGARLYANGDFGVGGTGVSSMPSAGSQLSVYGGTSMGIDYFTTAATTNGLIVEGNVGIGTLNPFGGNLIVNGGGNVGIGTLAPNGALDVGAGAICLGHVCNSTWPAAGANYWLLNGSTNVGINTTQAVGIGTSFVGGAGGEAALSIMNGNVGIGTWKPDDGLEVKKGGITIDSSGINMPSAGGFVDMADGDYINWNSVSIQGGSSWIYVSAGYEEISGNLEVDQNGVIGKDYAGVDNGPANGLLVEGNVGMGTFTLSSRLNVNGGVGIGTASTSGAYFANAAPAGGLIVQGNTGIGTFNPFGGKLIVSGGNVGVGSLAPGQLVDVQGTVRASYFIGNGAQLTGLPSGGGWTQLGTNVYTTTGSNNVGIGTTTPQGGLVVTNGNVGIGTWAPANTLDVNFGINEGEFGVDNLGFNSIKMGNTVGSIGFMVNNTVRMALGANGGLSIGATYINTDPGTGNMIVEGNLGIGTLVPGSALQVAGNVGVGTSAAGSTPRTLQINNIAVFNSEYNNGSPSSPITINWAKGNKQAVTLTATGMTVNFTNPSVGVGAFQLKVIQDGTGSRTVTAWTPSSGNIYWAGGSAPTLTTTATYLDIVSCYYDGTNYYCATTLNFQ